MLDKIEDKYLWLEEVEGEKALEWVNMKNAQAEKELFSTDVYKKNYKKALEVISDKDQLFHPSHHGEYTYSFWRDDNNPKGIYRRMYTQKFLSGIEEWEIVFDMDKYAKKNGENLSWHGAHHNEDETRAIIMISDGGKDEDEGYEFCLKTLSFVKDGFFFSSSKGWITWCGNDTIVYTRSYGENEVSEAGYPRFVRRAKRGEDLAEAKVIYEAPKESSYIYCINIHKEDEFVINEAKTFFENRVFIVDGDKKTEVKVPLKNQFINKYRGHYLFIINDDFLDYKSGDLVAFKFDETGEVSEHSLLMAPNEQQAIEYALYCNSGVIVNYTDNVKGNIALVKLVNGKWEKKKIEVEDNVSINFYDSYQESDDLTLIVGSFNIPNCLIHIDLKSGKKKVLKQTPSSFNHKDILVKQEFAISKDGTKVPYFIAHHKDVKYDGKNKTLIYGYGGFNVSLTPSFSKLRGSLWLEKGFVFVQTNIRGGGEFGPKWHQAALKLNRHKAYEDFFSIAEKLIADKVTSPKHLGAMGGSNGGLLMGVCLTQRSDLFGAINCGVPLLDMLRYHKLLAGASWVGEYGSPEIEEERKYLESYSPYQNLDPNKEYTDMFIFTSTRDDRVHPGHARKMAAKMDEYGFKNVYYEDLFGGHGASDSNESLAKMFAVKMTNLELKLG